MSYKSFGIFANLPKLIGARVLVQASVIIIQDIYVFGNDNL